MNDQDRSLPQRGHESRTLVPGSTIQEIEAAVERLPASERDAFESRLIARRLGLYDTTDQEYQALLASLDEADKQIDSGRGLSADRLRKRISAWAGK